MHYQAEMWFTAVCLTVGGVNRYYFANQAMTDYQTTRQTVVLIVSKFNSFLTSSPST